ncbi:hypothetical protein K8942_03805 [Candidatus Peribacteria bacterium]|nr:MAG: hypothetical protein K8942_03805 [Candidatus Peribacteria bacterium]
MPLKHSTETWLVFFLGCAVLVTGIACAILQMMSAPALAWGILFVLTIAYPLSLYPLFRERRADYAFRMLHFLPAGILLLWLFLQIVGFVLPSLLILSAIFVWGWSLPIVILAFAALFWFCFSVIRQRRQRSLLLGGLLLLLLVFGLSGERFQWPEQIASIFNGSSSSTGSGMIIAGNISSSSVSNLDPSLDENEEKWRAALRRQERRKERLLALENEPMTVSGALEGVLISGGSSSQIAMIPTKPGIKNPPHLPSSGPDIGVFLLIMIAVYSALLHHRAKLRVEN